MKPAVFDYVRPSSVQDAVSALASDPDAKVIAGGQSLVPLMNFRLASPTLLVDISRLDELDFIEVRDDKLCIGAGVRQREAERSVVAARSCALVAAALRWVGHPQIRNRGTVCGSLAHGDPSSELPAVAVATDAEFIVRNRTGERVIAARDFYLAPFWTALEEGDLLTEVRLPVDTPGIQSSVREYARRSGDFAIAGVAIRGTSGDGTPRASVGAFGVASAPVRMTATERLIESGDYSQSALDDAIATDVPSPTSDGQADGTYRLELLGELVILALADCGGRR